MPEYLAPGVYIEEVSFRSKSIEGVSTTTTGFIGPTRFGPLDLDPDIITSLGEFERVYGDRQQLDYSGSLMHNYLWHAVRAFFEEGGKRLYISRIFLSNSDTDDGYARGQLPKTAVEADSIRIRARFPGAAGNMFVRFTARLSQNILGGDAVEGSTELKPKVNSLMDRDVVWISDTTAPVSSPPGGGTLYLAESYYDDEEREDTWKFTDAGGDVIELSELTANLDPEEGDQVRIVTLAIEVEQLDGSSQVWDGIPIDPGHERDGSKDGLTNRFAEEPSNLSQARTLPIVVEIGNNLVNGLDVLQALLDSDSDLRTQIDDTDSTDEERSVDIELSGGNDGQRPQSTEYEGTADPDTTEKTGLKQFEDIEDISIVAAPGSTYALESSYRSSAMTIMSLLISHASRMRYRIAVLDSGDSESISQVRALRAKLDSTYAALYYPWVRILDPVTRAEIYLPPSGFVAGIYARNDVNRAVYKAPANEVVNLALGFEILLNKAQQDVLNPEGINCFRFFEGRGFRLWGARTISSDPEWKYVNLRRYFAYLERSIDRGTQWAVFEPNGDALWANVRRTIEDFLLNEWMSGALLGDKPEKAYFVRCDRSTMTQNDLDNGRLVCLVGVAALRPAEFVIFRIGQWTADRKS